MHALYLFIVSIRLTGCQNMLGVEFAAHVSSVFADHAFRTAGRRGGGRVARIRNFTRALLILQNKNLKKQEELKSH